MARILVIRLSALGDVAISVPLVQAIAEQYPEHEFTVVTQPKMAGLFWDCPSNVHLQIADIYNKHKGLYGLFRLFREIGPSSVDLVCDMHDVLRSRLLSFLFRCCRIPVFRIDKQRSERKKLTQKSNKQFRQLKTSFQKYRDVFAKAGLSLTFFDAWPKLIPSEKHLQHLEQLVGKKDTLWVGFAPFAKHVGKVYPFALSEQVLAELVEDSRITVFLFGGGADEVLKMEEWKMRFPKIRLISGISLQDEVKLMSCLDLMLTMDSANMHLGSLAHTPVVSIWGATHPYAGFYGLFQAERNAIQVDLSCRPCSVFGNKPCFRNDYACLNLIDPKVVIKRVKQELGLL
jgi:ADP-heptose:LPS heptosyltransferase